VTAARARPSIRRTHRGWRISQHGTVLSEVLRQPGPTHSVFDVLAAACLTVAPVRDIALLGFGGGSVVAALRALGCTARIHAVDLDPTGWTLLQQADASWLQPFTWHQGDAITWLQSAGCFDVVVDDLSIPRDGDVVKPDATWDTLPALVADRLRSEGLAIFNLLRSARLGWTRGIEQIGARFRNGVMIHLDAFENRILVAQNDRPIAASSALRPREFGAVLRSIGFATLPRTTENRKVSAPNETRAYLSSIR
jgi:spermidine synthase